MTDTSPDLWPIYVLSLQDAEARRAAISHALASRGLAFTFFDAIDGRRGLPPDHEKDIDRPGTIAALGREMSDAEYACALSHLAIYRDALAKGLPGAIVFEDDAILTPLFDRFLEARGFLAGDLVQMDHLHGDIWRSVPPTRLTDAVSLAPAARTASLTTGYTISARGARYFLDEGMPLCRSADWPADPTVIDGLLCLPRVVDHPPFDAGSAIESSRARLRAGQTRGPRATRFLKAAYWRRWWFKRRTRRVS